MYTKIVRDVNESQIARCIMNKKKFTKQEIAKETGLSFPTAGKTIDSFVDRKMVLEIGVDKNAVGGRKPNLYRLNEAFAYGLLMFFDRNCFSCEVINAVGKSVEKFVQPVKPSGYLATIREIISMKLADNPRIISIAIGVNGGVAEGKILYIDGYDELVNCELKRIIEQEYGLETAVENNMRAVVYGMADRNQLLKEETVVCLQIADNGPGCGILVNGKPLSGFAGLVGEVGYLPGYGDKNMQTIALSHFHDTDVTDYFARLITSVCVFLNPRRITLYKNPYIHDTDRLQKKCMDYLPEIAVPGIFLSEDYEKDYMAGLSRLVLNCFYPSYHIIKD